MGESSEARDEFWVQSLIVTARMMGISKRELLEDYYLDEFLLISDKFVKMKSPKQNEEVFIDQLGL